MTDSWSYTAPVVASWARARSVGTRRYTDPKGHLVGLPAGSKAWREAIRAAVRQGAA